MPPPIDPNISFSLDRILKKQVRKIADLDIYSCNPDLESIDRIWQVQNGQLHHTREALDELLSTLPPFQTQPLPIHHAIAEVEKELNAKIRASEEWHKHQLRLAADNSKYEVRQTRSQKSHDKFIDGIGMLEDDINKLKIPADDLRPVRAMKDALEALEELLIRATAYLVEAKLMRDTHQDFWSPSRRYAADKVYKRVDAALDVKKAAARRYELEIIPQATAIEEHQRREELRTGTEHIMTAAEIEYQRQRYNGFHAGQHEIALAAANAANAGRFGFRRLESPRPSGSRRGTRSSTRSSSSSSRRSASPELSRLFPDP